MQRPAKAGLYSAGLGVVQGITFTPGGRLFAAINNGAEIVELNPTTGAIINSLTGLSGLDGLTFDPTTGELWVSDKSNNGIREVPLDLSGSTLFAAGLISIPDGIEADGKGNIFVAEFNDRIDEYNIAGNTLTHETRVPGLDDLAPLTGLGSSPSPSPTPEPATWVLFGVGLIAAVLFRRRLVAQS